MPHVAWTLTDNSSGSPVVYSFPINPNTFDPPGREANIVQESLTAPNAQPLIFQGRDKVNTGSMTGLVNTEAFYQDLQLWADKHYVMVLTDDQGRSWNILITSVKWTRLRRAINQSRFDYTIDFLEVG
jgi:hypothetical protein